MNRNSSFGRRGVFTCQACGHKTRETGVQALGSELCPECWELAGIYNAFQDGGAEGVKEYAGDIRNYTKRIVDRGSKLDGDALELLEAIGEPVPVRAAVQS